MTAQSFTVAVQLDADTHAALDTAAWEAGMSLVAYASKVLTESTVKPQNLRAPHKPSSPRKAAAKPGGDST